jgi:hypothetical protein
VTSTTSLAGNAGAITLDNDANDFQGALSISNSGTNAVLIHDDTKELFPGLQKFFFFSLFILGYTIGLCPLNKINFAFCQTLIF